MLPENSSYFCCAKQSLSVCISPFQPHHAFSLISDTGNIAAMYWVAELSHTIASKVGGREFVYLFKNELSRSSNSSFPARAGIFVLPTN